jgi:hypothetical protein
MSDHTFLWVNALLYAIVELSRYITIHEEIITLETGVEALVSSQLTPALISVKEIQTILNNLTRTLSANGQKLCASTPQNVFESKSFQFMRHKDSLYIHLFFRTHVILRWQSTVRQFYHFRWQAINSWSPNSKTSPSGSYKTATCTSLVT